MMKSNSDPASMRTPSSVEIAPSTTGANMCSRATAERMFLLPIAVRKPCGGGEEKWVENLTYRTKLVLAARLGIPAFAFRWDSQRYTTRQYAMLKSCQHKLGSQKFPCKSLMTPILPVPLCNSGIEPQESMLCIDFKTNVCNAAYCFYENVNYKSLYRDKYI